MTDNATAPNEYGFVCPHALLANWDPKECSIYTTKEGDAIILDHGIQTIIYRGRNKEECQSFLKHS